jgi:hypothetical protein
MGRRKQDDMIKSELQIGLVTQLAKHYWLAVSFVPKNDGLVLAYLFGYDRTLVKECAARCYQEPAIGGLLISRPFTSGRDGLVARVDLWPQYSTDLELRLQLTTVIHSSRDYRSLSDDWVRPY